MKKTLLAIIVSLFIFKLNVNANDLVIDGLSSKSINDTYTMKIAYGDGNTATVVADPLNSAEKAIFVNVPSWGTFLSLNVVLPSGMTLSDFSGISYDFNLISSTFWMQSYIYLNNDVIYWDGVDASTGNYTYPQQASESGVWVTKSIAFSDLIVGTAPVESNGTVVTPGVVSKYTLSDTQKALTTFTLALGFHSGGNKYYMKNIKLISKASSGMLPAETNAFKPYVSHQVLYLDNRTTSVAIYDVNGALKLAAENVNKLDTSLLNSGVYLVKTVVDGKSSVIRFVK
ncbi:MAG: T9SS type A sorting domain-containing protein [Dysgonamonadaceae bacterium]